ncbi:MBL fold metallo-hydrolase [Salipiger abyssi]|uniref:MBL fold metallo-hydrolase n=1 Tax=Salipiger abyssi TaxID=1250539 RepID=UPI001A8DBF37|nr:MBL fold metallo-hydrolase [Salipiger abyssi]MBN9887316.1 MBL fold metallo-hydrolase [Salipiger abyssi]
MARLTALSGLGRKSAAIFLLEIAGKRLLLDMGTGLEAGERPDLSGAGRIDAVLLSHAHSDHVGALDRLDEIGTPTVFASAETLRQLPPTLRPVQCVALPERGCADVLGVTVETGRAGHAPGGIWMRFDTDHGGFLYTGDFSTETALLACDPFPRAATVLADASYGDREVALSDQVAALAKAAERGAVLPCPADGRGPDMVAALSARGLEVHACAQIAGEMSRLTGTRPLRADADTARPGQIIVAAGPNAEEGLPAALRDRAGFRFVFSGHVPQTSPAHAMISEGRARWMGWNVHPRCSDVVALADGTGAARVLPAFVDLATAPNLVAELGPRLCRATSLEV